MLYDKEWIEEGLNKFAEEERSLNEKYISEINEVDKSISSSTNNRDRFLNEKLKERIVAEFEWKLSSIQKDQRSYNTMLVELEITKEPIRNWYEDEVERVKKMSEQVFQTTRFMYMNKGVYHVYSPPHAHF
uniref:Uncharacterized protein n=1 Tax=Acrobeloides nanus TaxID=290746 RepID=A0A914CN31_9BILA